MSNWSQNEVQRCDRTVTELTFEFLDELKQSGLVTSGAWSDLIDEFGFNEATARSLLSDWAYLREEKLNG